MSKFWPTIFHVAFLGCPVLLALAMHNYGAAAAGAYSLVVSMLSTLGVGGAGIVSGAVAVVAFHKSVNLAKAEIPQAGFSKPAARKQLLSMLWSDLGPTASDAEITAFRQMREASPE